MLGNMNKKKGQTATQSPATPKRAVSDLDARISERQSFGGIYARPSNLEQAVNRYRSGQLALPPHPIWTGDPTDWAADPFSDRNWRFQHHTLRWLNPLRWAALDGDEAARAEWIRVVRSWADVNTPADRAVSDMAWKDMADGNRAIQLSLGVPLLTGDEDWFVDLLEYHRDWLMDEKHIVGKNHGLHQHQGLLVVGAALRDREAVETAVERMRAQFLGTFDKQGCNDEGSAAYHQMNMTWWRQGWDRAESEGITPPDDARDRLDAAAVALAHIALPNGEIPQIGDSRRGKVQMGHSSVTDYVASGGTSGTAPTETAMVLDGGYITTRSGWGTNAPLALESHALIRFGKEMRAHSHRDRGSVHLYSVGQRWLVDSGFHSYETVSAERAYLYSRAAHNVALLQDRAHNDNAPVDLIRHTLTEEYDDFLLVDRGYPDDDVRRRVTYLREPDCWVIHDSTSSPDARLNQHWHVEPGLRTRFLDNGFRIAGAGASFTMHWLGRGAHTSRLLAADSAFDAWIGTGWRTMEPSTRLVAKAPDRSRRLVTLMGAHREVPLSVVESRVSASGDTTVEIARGASRWRVDIPSGDATIRRL